MVCYGRSEKKAGYLIPEALTRNGFTHKKMTVNCHCGEGLAELTQQSSGSWWGLLLLMTEILHDVIYQNIPKPYRNYGSIVYVGQAGFLSSTVLRPSRCVASMPSLHPQPSFARNRGYASPMIYTRTRSRPVDDLVDQRKRLRTAGQRALICMQLKSKFVSQPLQASWER